MTKTDDNPMHPTWRTALEAAREAPRCTARSKRTGDDCRAPAVCGWYVCRMHGARGGHRAGPSHPSWRHGVRSRAWIDERRHISELVREMREIDQLL